MFSNRPARKLLKLFYDAKRMNADFKVDCLQKKMFTPIKEVGKEAAGSAS